MEKQIKNDLRKKGISFPFYDASLLEEVIINKDEFAYMLHNRNYGKDYTYQQVLKQLPSIVESNISMTYAQWTIVVKTIVQAERTYSL